MNLSHRRREVGSRFVFLRLLGCCAYFPHLSTLIHTIVGILLFWPRSEHLISSGSLARFPPAPPSAPRHSQSVTMCLMSVKEEPDYTVPARVTRVRRVVRRSPSPPRTARYTRQSYVEERRPSYNPPPPPEPIPSPPSVHETRTVKSERRSSRAPSRAPSLPPPPSAAPTRRSESHFVEVDHESSSSSSSSSSDEDVRSRTTRKSSRSKTTAPASEYSMHEREYRRERGYSSPRPEYETYRYVEAPKDRSISRGPRGSYHDGSRASRDGGFRRETRVVIEDDNGRRKVEYRR